MANELKTKLDQVEADLRGLREDLAGASRTREAAKEKYAETIAEGGDEAEAHKAAMDAMRVHGEIREKIDGKQQEETDLLRLLGRDESASRNGDEPKQRREGRVGASPIDGWSSAELFASEELRGQLEFLAGSKSRFGSIEIGEVASRERIVADVSGMYAADVDGTARMREGAYRGVQPALYRPLSFLNLIPTGTTDGNLVPYTQENVVTGGAEEVAEGDVKPEAGLTFTDADAPVATIAAWMKTRKQALADVAALRSTIDTRLRYLVQQRLEEQVLNGDGTGVNLLGILETPGIGSVAYNANVPLGELVLSGITNVFLNHGSADGVALNPIDWQSMVTQKAANAGQTAGSFDYYGGGPFGSTPATLWGIRATPTAALDQGQGLVGDFGLGAQLLIREGVRVLFSDSDQDDFIRNRVTLLGEMRAALLVWRPALFQELDLAA